MGASLHQSVAQGYQERAWLLSWSAPVTNHMLPLEHPPRSFWELLPPSLEYLATACQRGQGAACACVRRACWGQEPWLQIASTAVLDFFLYIYILNNRIIIKCQSWKDSPVHWVHSVTDEAQGGRETCPEKQLLEWRLVLEIRSSSPGLCFLPLLPSRPEVCPVKGRVGLH